MKAFNAWLVVGSLLLLLPTCKPKQEQATYSPSSKELESRTHATAQLVDNNGETLLQRISPPDGYQRIPVSQTSFAYYLRTLPLKPAGTLVSYFDVRSKSNKCVYVAVVDLPIGKRDLHQCADAIMRLRAEYLYQQKAFDRIHFNFTNGFRVDYTPWMQGKRFAVEGNRTYWVQKTTPSNTYQDFWKYLEIIFSYAGTLSLEKELQATSVDQLKIGDVFIQGGSPGHAVVVVDVAINPTTKQKVFMLAQSYMPAQEIQILSNIEDASMSPWYSTNFGETLYTPEWTFKKTTLKRFAD
ncbi:MAG: DUF4846 domain-containing protein [Thermonemataceae bacterium]